MRFGQPRSVAIAALPESALYSREAYNRFSRPFFNSSRMCSGSYKLLPREGITEMADLRRPAFDVIAFLAKAGLG